MGERVVGRGEKIDFHIFSHFLPLYALKSTPEAQEHMSRHERRIDTRSDDREKGRDLLLRTQFSRGAADVLSSFDQPSVASRHVRSKSDGARYSSPESRVGICGTSMNPMAFLDRVVKQCGGRGTVDDDVTVMGSSGSSDFNEMVYDYGLKSMAKKVSNSRDRVVSHGRPTRPRTTLQQTLRPISGTPTATTYNTSLSDEEFMFIPPPTAPMLRIERTRSHSAPQRTSPSSQKQKQKRSSKRKEKVRVVGRTAKYIMQYFYVRHTNNHPVPVDIPAQISETQPRTRTETRTPPDFLPVPPPQHVHDMPGLAAHGLSVPNFPHVPINESSLYTKIRTSKEVRI